jgi:diguanylate cyclase (GGDEF)-like protein
MQWSIRNKLILGGGILMAMFAVFAHIAHQQTRLVADRLIRSTTIEAPLKDAALEMEINLLGTGFAVLSYLNDQDPAHLARIRDDTDDFSRFQKQYETLAYTPQLKELAAEVKAGYARFLELADQLLKSRNEQTRKVLDALAEFQALDRLLDEKLLPSIRSTAPQAAEKRQAVRAMKAELDELKQSLLGFHITFDAAWKERMHKTTLGFNENRERYLRTPLSSQEKGWMRKIARDFGAGQMQIDELFAWSDSKRRNHEEFITVRNAMDDLLDDKMQLKSGIQMDTEQEQLSAAIARMDVLLLGLLLGAGALGVLMGLAVYRGVTGPINRLHTMTQALAQGEFVGPDALAVNNEFSALTRSFGEMAMARKQAEEEIRTLNAGLEQRIARRTEELAETNHALERYSDEVAQITKMSNLLQTADDMTEANEILSLLLPRLIAPHGGAVYLTANSLNRLDCLAQWGDTPHPPVINPEDCWGMRRGGFYGAGDPEHDMFCAHARTEAGHHQPYVCVPLMAQSTSLGLLHIAFNFDSGLTEVRASEQARVLRLADQIGLALANLKLRLTLREQSIRDALTGLHNRRYLEESLEREVARAARDSNPLAVLMIDLDHFKRYNDQYGHNGGDALLRALGRILKQSGRASDLIARYGGEEFTVLLHNTSLAGASAWCEELRNAVQKMEIRSAEQLLPPITISLGLALYPENGVTADELLSAADAALYEAKRDGRDCLVVAAPQVGKNTAAATAPPRPSIEAIGVRSAAR